MAADDNIAERQRCDTGDVVIGRFGFYFRLLADRLSIIGDHFSLSTCRSFDELAARSFLSPMLPIFLPRRQHRPVPHDFVQASHFPCFIWGDYFF